ncbi:MAG: hypothetical protein OQL16_07480 [Gammaproteobacteria bacterium]|nr:hypothetical protein [Gammaproteobacteria bacterium]
MQPGPIGICFSAALLSISALPVFAQDSCPEELQTRLIQKALYEGDGYRPLTIEEQNEMADDNGSSESSENWRPRSQADDCEKLPSLVDPEERGYRPLDYGTQRQQVSPSYGGHSGYMPGYPGGYDWRYAPYQGPYNPPVYPNTPLNNWPRGSSPYYTRPQVLPGYGVMPYSFGGNSSVPY